MKAKQGFGLYIVRDFIFDNDFVFDNGFVFDNNIVFDKKQPRKHNGYLEI